MDFAKKYMEKYGWQEGKGLGKKESGISERLRLKSQKDAVGLGYDRTKGINTQTWFAQLDEEIRKSQKRKKKKHHEEEKEEEVQEEQEQKNQDDDDDNNNNNNVVTLFTNSVSYQGHFVKGTSDDSLGSEGKKKKKKKHKIDLAKEDEAKEKEEEDSERMSLDLDKLYKKTNGATCHRTAHVGLKLSGKLQRLQEQERSFKSFENS